MLLMFSSGICSNWNGILKGFQLYVLWYQITFSIPYFFRNMLMSYFQVFLIWYNVYIYILPYILNMMNLSLSRAKNHKRADKVRCRHARYVRPQGLLVSLCQNEAWHFTTRFDVSWSFYHQFGVQTLVFFLNSFGCLPFVPSVVYSLWQLEGNWREVLHWRNKSMCLVILFGELYRITIWCGHFIATCRCLLPKSSPKAAMELP